MEGALSGEDLLFEQLVSGKIDIRHYETRIGQAKFDGKRVRSRPRQDTYDQHIVGKEGVVRGAFQYEGQIGVEFDEEIRGGHDLGGRCKYGYGWYVFPEDIEIIE